MAAEGTAIGQRMYEFAQLGGAFELFQRMLGGLYAYEQSLSQASEYVAMVMLVSAIEALSVPSAPWQGTAKVARFKDFVLHLAPETLDQVMTHRNFPAAFSHRRSPKMFLEDLSSRRSRPLHGGFLLRHNDQGFLGDLTQGPMRVALVSGLVHDCIANFLFAPMSMLTGQPTSSGSRPAPARPGTATPMGRPCTSPRASPACRPAAATSSKCRPDRRSIPHPARHTGTAPPRTTSWSTSPCMRTAATPTQPRTGDSTSPTRNTTPARTELHQSH